MENFFLKRKVLICLFAFFSFSSVVLASNNANRNQQTNNNANNVENQEVNINANNGNQQGRTNNSILDTLAKCAVLFSFGEFIFGRVLDSLVRNEIARLQIEENERLLHEMCEKYFYGDQSIDPTACSDLLSELLEKIVGQEEAKGAIVEQFCAQIFKLKKFYSGNSNMRRGPGAEIYCFAGKPGLGKTFMANLLARALCAGQEGKKIFTIDASTILSFDKKRRNPATLFARIGRYRKEKHVIVNSDIFSYIKATLRPVIVFNEIDKLLNDPDLKLSLFEFIRSVQEDGYISNDVGEKVDCSGLTLIFTSNDPDMISEESLKTRFRTILFKPFSEGDYCKLVRSYLNKFIASANEMLKKNPASDLSFHISDECCSAIAKEISENSVLYSKGFRCVEKDFIAKLSGFLFKYLFPSKNKEDFAVTGDRTIGYDNKKHAFFIL